VKLPTKSADGKICLTSLNGVAELGYEIEKSMISNSYSLRLERLCVKQNHTLNQQRPLNFSN
jgi:hypothetical protein